MTTPTSPETGREQQLHQVILTLVQALEKGQAPDRSRFQAAHPEFAAELEEFFAGRDRLERLAAPLRAAAGASHSPAGEPDLQSGFGESDVRAVLMKEGPSFPPDQGQTHREGPSPGPTPPLGSLGDFRLLREVGRGGMGIVYEAEQISLNRRVALKMLPLAAALDPRQLQRFKNEAQAAALLHNPNIVPIHAVGCERGIHYYAMQFIDGLSLAALLQELRQSADGKNRDVPPATPGPALALQPTPTDGDQTAPRTAQAHPPTPGPGDQATPPAAAMSTERSARRSDFFRRVVHLVRMAAEALEHAHQVGVVHRDIKPANLLLDGRGTLWITDFGLALLQNSAGLTTTGELVGTLRYMSPEQALAKRGLVDHRTDIYSLGVTLYELLTLEPLFESTDSHHLLHQIALEEPRPPRSVDPAIPIDLETIVLKAIAKGPADRYATAQDLADDLQRFLGDQPVRARRPTLLDRAVKWSRRHRPVVVSALGLLVAAAVALLVSTVLIARAHQEVKDAYQRERQKAGEAQQRSEEAQASFAQARQAVDFLAQVSAEELVDKPEVLEVRRKLFEGALQYYQEFIDQHQDDPSIEAALAASRARVAQILSDLSAQDDYFRLMQRTMLLEEKTVQVDLGLTSAQQVKVTDLSDRLTQHRHEAFGILSKLPEKERVKKFKEMAADDDQATAAILTPAQVKRLKQIALQQRGPQAFGDPEVAKSLQLSRDQQASLRAIQDQAQRTWEACRHGCGPGEADQKARQIVKGAGELILAILTPSQKTAWQEMTGEPFGGQIHFFPPAGFPPPGPGPHPGGLPPPDRGPGPGRSNNNS